MSIISSDLYSIYAYAWAMNSCRTEVSVDLKFKMNMMFDLKISWTSWSFNFNFWMFELWTSLCWTSLDDDAMNQWLIWAVHGRSVAQSLQMSWSHHSKQKTTNHCRCHSKENSQSKNSCMHAHSPQNLPAAPCRGVLHRGQRATKALHPWPL